MYKPDKIWDRFAKGYNKKPVSDEGIYQEKLARTRKFLTPQSEILEFGCGTGSTAIAHAPFVKHIDAIDVSEKMLAFGHEKAAASDIHNVTFTCADITSFSATGKEYDVVLGLSILHLLEDKDAVISEIFQILKPGGVFISSTVVMTKKRPILSGVLRFGKMLGLLPLVRFFSTQDLVQSLQMAGFKIEQNWQASGADSVFIVARKPD